MAMQNYSILKETDNDLLYSTSSYPLHSTGEVEHKTDNLAMSFVVQMAWTVVFVVMIFTAIFGNCIVIWIVLSHKRMRTITNYFLVNLSIADLLLSTLNCFFNFIYMLQGDWRFGRWYCTANNFIANVTVAASVFTLTGITCDRYLAIVHPLQPRMSKSSSIITIIFIWLASMAIAFPCLLYSTTIIYKFREKERTACLLVWPDGQPTDSNMDFAYQVSFLALTYVIPMALMLWCYSEMGKVLWGSRSIGEQTQRQMDSVKSKRKVVKMFIFIVTVFCVCWLPYHGYFIYTHIDRSVVYSKYVQHVYLGFYWFAMANAMVNPLIYYWMNARFRQYYKTVLCIWKTVIRKSSGRELDSRFGRQHTFSSKSGNISQNTSTCMVHLQQLLDTDFEKEMFLCRKGGPLLSALNRSRSTKSSLYSSRLQRNKRDKEQEQRIHISDAL